MYLCIAWRFLPQNPSTENRQIPGCSLILSVDIHVRMYVYFMSACVWAYTPPSFLQVFLGKPTRRPTSATARTSATRLSRPSSPSEPPPLRIVQCFIYRVSLLCSALYAECPYYVVLYMQSVLII